MSDQDQPGTPETAAGGTGSTSTGGGDTPTPVKKTTRPRKKAAAKPPASAAGEDGAPAAEPASDAEGSPPAKKTTRPRKKAAAKKTAPAASEAASTLPLETQAAPAAAAPEPAPAPSESAESGSGAPMVVFQPPEKPVTRTTTRSRSRKAAAPSRAVESDAGSTASETEPVASPVESQPAEQPAAPPRARKTAARGRAGAKAAVPESESSEEGSAPSTSAEALEPSTEAPVDEKAPTTRTRKRSAKPAKKAAAPEQLSAADVDDEDELAAAAAQTGTPETPDTANAAEKAGAEDEQHDDDEPQGEGGARRRSRRRGGRRRRKGSSSEDGEREESTESTESVAAAEDQSGSDAEDQSGDGASKRRRTRSRTPKSPEDEITSVTGSTRLEAKKQRRREGREAGRRRAPIVSEAEFLARRESVDRVMVIRQRGDLTQIAVVEDKVLVEHYVSRESQTSLIGNVYLGRVQNVLPSMEAAFIDIGKGRNAVLYAGEVNWSALGHKEGEPRKIESVLQSGQTILVQVSKDPIGHKGARLTSQVSLPGRFLVYVPDGTTSGISRKLPDTERNRLKTLLKQIVPDSAGVIVRTAAEGASEEELTQDVERLTARWQDIEAKVKAGRSPELLYGEPDLTLKVVRDLFTEDFSRLVVQGDEAWDLVDGYVAHVAPDLRDRLERYQPEEGEQDGDVFASFRVDEQIAKALDRKVWLPSGGSLVIDRTEAMTVVDVNTGKFTGSGGNLEETVTKNNLEAAEEIVRQLRLRDIGGIIVVDFIDMVLESNRDLVLRRLVECLGRDRTRHQVAEVTSLGLVQMTRKRIGTGLVEAFSEECSHCKGRGLVVHEHPIETAGSSATDDEPRRRRGGRTARGRNGAETKPEPTKPSPKDLAATRPPTGQEVDGNETSENETGHATDLEPVEAPPKAAERHDDEAAAPEVEPSQVESSDSAQVDDSTEDTPPSSASAAAVEIPAAPVVVTTTRRRRTATRPAGPPAAADGSASATEGQDGLAARSHSDGDADAEGAEALDEAGQPIPHVPVKKKGSRKH